MPNKDGTGPLGEGPITGRGFGPCGRGRRFGRGLRWKESRYEEPVELTREQKIKILKEEKKEIEKTLEELNNERQ